MAHPMAEYKGNIREIKVVWGFRDKEYIQRRRSYEWVEGGPVEDWWKIAGHGQQLDLNPVFPNLKAIISLSCPLVQTVFNPSPD
uniref:Uncharacterized protein n=1 Tax=Oryza glumipatula TaxID=40148 RepID=A0A0E0BRW6_9ORYZ